jgi:hypothetical protein
MSIRGTQHRTNFSQVAIGQRFYDPISAEYFVKQSETTAAMVTGIGDGTVADEFEPDDVVGIENE